jgi:hypothetical protein
MAALVRAASLAGVACVMWIASVKLHDLRRFCAREGVAYTIAFELSHAVLFIAGVAAAVDVVRTAILGAHVRK